MDFVEVSEINKSAGNYLQSLQQLLDALTSAELQINNSAKETNLNIEKYFVNLKTEVVKTLDKRKCELVKKLAQVKHESLAPINDCKRVILEKISATSNLIELGDDIIKTKKDDNMSTFSKASAGLGNLPEVPELKYVPSLSFYNNSSDDHYAYLKAIGKFGAISKIAPIQISLAMETPGGIFLKFKNTDEIFIHDIDEYRLQMAKGNALQKTSVESSFKNIYIGDVANFHVKQLLENMEYSFRVCCKLGGCVEWSPWSTIEVAKTKIRPYQWMPNDCYELSESNKVAMCMKNGENYSIFSRDEIIGNIDDGVSNCIEFKILEIGSDLKNNFIGIISTENIQSISELTNSKGTILVEMNGDVFIDGVKKTTKLDAFKHGSKLSFIFKMNKTNMQIHIDSNNKRITYFWHIPCRNIYFCAGNNSPGWKIMVQ